MAMVSGVTLAVAGATAVLVIADTQQATVDLRFDLQRSHYSVVRSLVPTPAGFDSQQVTQIASLEPVDDAGEFSIWSQAESVAPAANTGTIAFAPIVVADAGGIAASGTVLVSGASPSPGASRGPGIWLGEELAAEIGLTGVHDQVRVNGAPLEVAGVVKNSGAFEYANRAVLMSRQTALSTFEGVGQNIRLVARVRPGAASAVAEFTVKVADPTGELELKDVTPPDGQRLVKDVRGDLRRLAVALGAFAGIAGIFGIANTLMMSVLTRRRELGLRSAIGWSRRRIGTLVLLESLVAGLIAGLVGAAAGSAIAALAAWQQGWTLVVDPWLPAAVVTAGVFASLVGGALPALRAASISPLEAMRS